MREAVAREFLPKYIEMEKSLSSASRSANLIKFVAFKRKVSILLLKKRFYSVHNLLTKIVVICKTEKLKYEVFSFVKQRKVMIPHSGMSGTC